MKNRELYVILKFMAVAVVVSCSLATSCPNPLPPIPPDPQPDTLSAERLLFESFGEIGLYIDGEAVVKYDETSYQKAWRPDGSLFRIQRDDQRVFMNIEQANFVNTAFNVTYMAEDGNQTILILNAKVVKQSGDRRWLWNEARRIGVIVQ